MDSKSMIDSLKFLNEIGLWEILNSLVVSVGAILGVMYLIRKRRIPMLNIFTSHRSREGMNYTSLIDIEFRNYTGCSVVICNPFFKYEDLKPDPAARRDSYSGEAEVKFIGKVGNGLTEVEFFLAHKESTTTWIPIDPGHKESEIKVALGKKKVGVLYFTCVWVKERPSVERMAIRI